MGEAVYTQFANVVLMKTSVVTARMSSKPVGKTRPRRVVIQEPSGPSTSGGKTARQAMLLAYGDEAAVCGWVDFIAGSCGLRDFPAMQATYKQRFRKKFDITREEYLEFYGELKDCLAEFEVTTAFLEPEPGESAYEEDLSEDEPPPPPKKKPKPSAPRAPAPSANASGGMPTGTIVVLIVLAGLLGMGLMVGALKLFGGDEEAEAPAAVDG